MLPDIDIKIRSAPNDFLKEMVRLSGPNCAHEPHGMSAWLPDGMMIENFRCRDSSPHVGLGFQLIANTHDSDRVFVEVRAERWNGDTSYPTSEVYIEIARKTAGELLRAYNRFFGTRLRLRIKAPVTGPVPSKNTLIFFNRFAKAANTSVLHPLDWRRFYEFVRHTRQRLDEQTVAQLLRKRGFSEEYARHLTEIYGHLMEYKYNF